MLASVDAIQQMTVIANGAYARYAQPSVVNIITRGGSNRFHCSAFDFLQNDDLNAQNYSLTGVGQVKTPSVITSSAVPSAVLSCITRSSSSEAIWAA